MVDNLPRIIVYIYYALLIVLSLYGLHRLFMVYLFLKYRKKKFLPKGEFEKLPMVTIQLPIYNEMYVVERLLEGVSTIKYPKEKIEIQVLDDSTDETVEVVRKKVEEMKKEGFDIRCIHRVNRVGFKAGALAEGMKTAKGEYILIFDADFVPPEYILEKTIHFFTDEKVGAVQVRWGHLNWAYSLLTKVQGVLLDGHFVIEHSARIKSGRFINFNGTAGIWRKSALESSGGWHSDTLTEDLDVSFRAQLKGWQLVYLIDVVSPAELPVSINALKSQQTRWTKGAIQTTKKLLPVILETKLPFKVKLESILHLTSNFAYLFTLALILIMLPATIVRANYQMYTSAFLDMVAFFSCTIAICVFYFYSQKEIYKNWWQRFKYIPFVLSLGVGMSINNAKAVLEGMFSKHSIFERTPKYNVISKRDKWMNKKYKNRLDYIFLFEIFLTVYTLVTSYFSYIYGMYGAMPFQLLFAFGFIYIVLGTLHEKIKGAIEKNNKDKSQRPPQDEFSTLTRTA